MTLELIMRARWSMLDVVSVTAYVCELVLACVRTSTYLRVRMCVCVSAWGKSAHERFVAFHLQFEIFRSTAGHFGSRRDIKIWEINSK